LSLSCGQQTSVDCGRLDGFSVTTHFFPASTINASRAVVWYSLAVGSGRLDAVSNLAFVLPI
jgi:hypothetical protein